jgi:hypothetical protein
MVCNAEFVLSLNQRFSQLQSWALYCWCSFRTFFQVLWYAAAWCIVCVAAQAVRWTHAWATYVHACHVRVHVVYMHGHPAWMQCNNSPVPLSTAAERWCVAHCKACLHAGSHMAKYPCILCTAPAGQLAGRGCVCNGCTCNRPFRFAITGRCGTCTLLSKF